MVNDFFYNLTKNNWGFPWHIILAWLGTDIAMYFDVHWFICLFSINVIGFIYERIQNQKDTAQDLIANNIGCILGMI